MNAAALLCASCVALLAAQRAPLAQAPARTVALGYVLPDSSDSRQLAFDRGARLGMAEAQHAASLLRRALSVIELSPSAPGAETTTRLENAGAMLIVAPALGEPLARQLAAWAAAGGRAIVAPSMTGEAPCAIPLFRTGPDSTLRARIAAANNFTTPMTDDVGAGVPRTPARAELWHHSLERFGARQLSDRYAQRYGTPMTSDAWEGWMAIKAAWESAVRARDGSAAAVLERGTFDGHKGVALRFGTGDRILRQPVIIVSTEAGSDRQGKSGVVANAAPVNSLREVAWPTAGAIADGDSAATSLPCTR